MGGGAVGVAKVSVGGSAGHLRGLHAGRVAGTYGARGTMGIVDIMTMIRLRSVSSVLAIFAMAFALLSPTVSKASQYFTVTTTSFGEYRVGLVGAGPSGTPSYDDADNFNWMVPFVSTPWHGNSVFATEIAEAVAFAAGTVGISFRAVYSGVSTDKNVSYAWAAQRPNLTFVSQSRTVGQDSSITDGGVNIDSQYWITQVPEIDGPVLAQAMFVLGALYLMLRGQVWRRRAVA